MGALKSKHTLLCRGPGLQNAANSLLSTLIKGTGSVNNSKELMKISSSGRQHVASPHPLQIPLNGE